MSDPLELDQEDFAARLQADPYFTDIAVLIQRKGVTDSDIDVALSVLNERTGKIGACVVLLMPALAPESPNVPGPLYRIITTVQVIEQPLFNLGTTGTGKSAEQISRRVRVLLHHFCNGFGAFYVCEGMEPIPVDTGKISYGVKFSRSAGDGPEPRVATPTLSAPATTAPTNVTIACATAGATIWYTTDGSYPSSANAAAIQYAAPISITVATTVRAAAEKLGLLQSNVSQLILS